MTEHPAAAATREMSVPQQPPPRHAEGELRRGDALGRYTILERLGAGGMGVVYAAYDSELNRRIAVKLLRGSGAKTADDVGRSRLIREAQAMAQLDHPNVVTVYEVGEHRGDVFVAMEFIEGRTLGDWLAAEKPDWRAVLEVMRQAALGLAAAHAAGLVHRDFKPDNVMVSEGRRVRVMDFGLVRATSSEAEQSLSHASALQRSDGEGLPSTTEAELSLEETLAQSSLQGELASGALTVAGALLGTPAYMSPEQYLRHDADARSDQFSFCVTLWEALYGERPFRGSSLFVLGYAVTTGKREAIPRGRRVPSWIHGVLDRGLQLEPAQRFPSMQAVLLSLDTGRRRTAWRRGLAAAGVMAMSGAVAAGMWQWDMSRRIAACDLEGEAVAEVWNEAAAVALADGLRRASPELGDPTSTRAAPWIDTYARRWRDARTEACRRAEVMSTWDAETLDRSRWCLDDRMASLRATLAEFSSEPDRAALARLLPTLANMPEIEPCLSAQTLQAMSIPPADLRGALEPLRRELAEIDAKIAAAEFEPASAAARELATRVESSGWPPLALAAKLRVARALDELGDYEDARTAYESVYYDAATAGLHDVAFDAALGMAWVVGYRLDRTDEGLGWTRLAGVAEAQLERNDLRLARRSSAEGLLERERGNHDVAAEAFTRVAELQRSALGQQHPELGQTLTRLGNVHQAAADFEAATEAYAQAYEIRATTLGPSHPLTLGVELSQANLAAVQGDREAALLEYARLKTAYEAALGPDHPDVARVLGNYAETLREAGKVDEALPLAQRAVDVYVKRYGRRHASTANAFVALGNIHYLRGDAAAARASYDRALAGLEATVGPTHHITARVIFDIALVDRAVGQNTRAEAGFTRALALLETALGPDHPEVANVATEAAIFYVMNERAEEAFGQFERAYRIRLARFGATHEQTLIALENYAEIHWNVAQFEGGVVLARKLLDARMAQTEPQPGKVAQARFLLARLLAASAGGRGEARSHASAALDAYASIPDPYGQKAQIEAFLNELPT